MLEQIQVWREGFGCGQCSGVDGLMEQVPEWDIGAGSLLVGDGGASCSSGSLGAGLEGHGREGSAVGVMDKAAVCRVLEQGPVHRVEEIEQKPVQWE